MSSVTFSGLASGLDTDSIVESLMEIESEPITQLENDIEYYEAETDAYAELDSLLDTLLTSVEKLDTADDLTTISANSTNEDILTATTTSIAMTGTYHITVESLAEAQKDVSDEGFEDTSTESLTGSLTIGDTTIDYDSVSLTDLVEMINDADAGVEATIINDGSEENPYRLRISGSEAGVTTEISGTGSIEIDTLTDGHTYDASQAHIVVDNIDIYSSSNTIAGAVPGVTLNLNDSDSSDEIVLTVESSTNDIASKIEDFVDSYNTIMEWISAQSDNEVDWANDSSLRGLKRKLQSFISKEISSAGNYTSLASIGLETDYSTGELSFDSSVLSEALSEDPDSVIALLGGTDDDDGIADKMVSYLDAETDSTDGLYARRSNSNDETIDRLNDQIEKLEARLEKREETLLAQFSAMEELISEMNTMSSYLDEISALSSSDD